VNTKVLFSNENVTSSLPVSFASNTSIPTGATMTEAKVTFTIAYISKTAQIAVILSDEYGNQAGNVTVTVSAAGTINVSVRDIMATLLAQYSQTSFQIRAIRGSILKVSLGIVTENVAVNIDPSVTSTLSYTTVVSTTVAPTTTVPTTTTTKPPVATLIASNTITNGAVFGIVFGSIAAGVFLIAIVFLIIASLVIYILNRRKRIRLEEQNNRIYTL
jgi:hypothetical protein